MEDGEIMELFRQRSEEALALTERKYFKYCYSIAYAILRNHEDARECVNDTLNRAWQAIPPARPATLRTYLGKITRNLALNALEKAAAGKRGGGEAALAISELEECLPGGGAEGDQFIEREAITRVLNRFLGSLEPRQRRVFVRRYWYADSPRAIAADYGMNAGQIKSLLFRLRRRLKTELEKEGVSL